MLHGHRRRVTESNALMAFFILVENLGVLKIGMFLPLFHSAMVFLTYRSLLFYLLCVCIMSPGV